MSRKLIIKNRRNNEEQLELTLEEFKAKFQMELKQAINTYKAHQESKNFLPPFLKPTPNYEQDFYFDLRWNFNNYAQTQYYIAQ
ncbi:unknown [Clostridium sp. CAG:813]|nr:unknown [Clostridium sp. CAG:813]